MGTRSASGPCRASSAATVAWASSAFVSLFPDTALTAGFRTQIYYEPALMITRLALTAAARLAEAPLLPLDPVRVAPELRARISSLSQEPPPATDRNEERTEHNYGTR